MPKTNGNPERSSLEDRLRRNTPSTNKYGQSVDGLNNKLGLEDQPSEHYTTVRSDDMEFKNIKTDSGGIELELYSNMATPDIDKAKKSAVAGGGSMAVYTRPVENYKTSEDDDFTKTYGTSIKRASGSQLGYDSLQSRAHGTMVLYDNRKIVKNAADKCGVPTNVMAACIFTEQSCNVTGIEDLTDALKFAKEQNAGFGMGQV